MKEIFPAKWYLHAAQCTSSSISVTRKWSALRRAASASSARRALSAAFTCRSTVRTRETCGFCTVLIAGVQWKKVRQARALRRLTCSVHRNLARVCLGDVQSNREGNVQNAASARSARRALSAVLTCKGAVDDLQGRRRVQNRSYRQQLVRRAPLCRLELHCRCRTRCTMASTEIRVSGTESLAESIA